MSEFNNLVEPSETDPKKAGEELDKINEATQFLTFAHDNPDLFRSIYITVPVRPGDGIETDLARMLSIWTLAGIQWADTSHISGGFIETIRAGIAYSFIHDPFFKNFQYLMMIDNDMSPNPGDVWLPYLLARHGEAVVGGCAVTLAEFGPMLCFTVKDENGSWRFPAMHLPDGTPLKIPARGLVECGHVGTGIICIRRDVLESFSWDASEPDGIPFFVPDHIKKKAYKKMTPGRGEDVEFSAQCRRKGFKLYVDLEAHIGHRKPTVLRWFRENIDETMDSASWVCPLAGRLIQGY